MGLLILTLTLLVSQSSNSFAITTGDLYKGCKPYADRAFEGSETGDIICLSYFAGVADSGYLTCSTIKGVIPNLTGGEKIIGESIMQIEGLDNANGARLRQAIQLFVNEMQALPEKWESNAISFVHNSLRKISPCE